jgi:hypothetical protein
MARRRLVQKQPGDSLRPPMAGVPSRLRLRRACLAAIATGEFNMFKKGLLITTALVLAASIYNASAQSPAHHGSRLRDAVAHRNVNDEFLCTYGALDVSIYGYSSSSGWGNGWTQVAVPINGHGETVTKIIVRESQSQFSDTTFFTGIYSNTASGLPGKLIAGNQATAISTCKPVEIRIAPTKLARKTRYWIKETVSGGYSASYFRHQYFWALNQNPKRKAYVQSHRKGDNSESGYYSSTTPWIPQSAGPYLKLR